MAIITKTGSIDAVAPSEFPRVWLYTRLLETPPGTECANSDKVPPTDHWHYQVHGKRSDGQFFYANSTAPRYATDQEKETAIVEVWKSFNSFLNCVCTFGKACGHHRGGEKCQTR